MQARKPDDWPPRLGRREKQVLHLAKQGLRDADIAQRLTIKPGTVRTYVSRLKQKFQVASRTELGAAGRRYEDDLGEPEI